MARSVTDEIEDLAAKRTAAWASGDAALASRIAGQLDALYAEKRSNGAEHGSERARKRAVERAVAERELDRLMQGQPVTPRPIPGVG